MRYALTVLALIVVMPLAVGDETVTVDPTERHQIWQGWGTSLSWWATMVGGWSNENREAIMGLLFDPDTGLGMNIVRYNIGAGDDPSHEHVRVGVNIESFWPGPDKPYDWSADANQRKVLLESIARGVNITEAFTCSPPYWMTVSGCSSGAAEAWQNNLRDEQYDAFADYLTEVVRHYRDEWGVTFDTLAPMNEPSTHYWKAGTGQQGCHFDHDKQNLLLRNVAAKLKAKGLATELSAADETCTEHAVQSFRKYDADVQAAIAQINTHTYNYSYDRSGPRHLADQFGKRLTMSEICWASREEGHEHDHEAIKGVLDMASGITRDLREMQPDAWVFWQSGRA